MQEITNKIIYLGQNDEHRDFFDELLPLEHGTSYNSYLIKGSEKNALIDGMYLKKADEYLKELDELGIKIDYIIANHGEQDHTGIFPMLLEKYPEAVIVTNNICKTNLMNMLEIPEGRIQTIQNGEELSLGDKTLRFMIAQGVHWPDTMFTYLVEDNYLFTCDFLGAHYVVDNIYAKPSKDLERAAKKYYAEIMMPFRAMCKKYLGMIEELNPKMILPSHGCIYREPKYILDLYKNWTSDECKNLVLLPYVSMYKNSKSMVDYVCDKLEKQGIECIKYDLIRGNIADFAINLVDAKTIILGCSMVLASPHPAAFNAAYLLSIMKPKAKNYSILASFGWGGKLTEPIVELLSKLRANIVEPVMIKGNLKESDYKLLDEFSEKIIALHQDKALV